MVFFIMEIYFYLHLINHIKKNKKKRRSWRYASDHFVPDSCLRWHYDDSREPSLLQLRAGE